MATGLDGNMIQGIAESAAVFIAVIALAWQVRAFRHSLADGRNAQLSSGAGDPVAIAAQINAHRLEQAELADFDEHPEECELRRCRVLAEMYLDLADVVSEQRRIAGELMDFSLWERYFTYLSRTPHVRRSLEDNKDYYTDQMFALFGQLTIRDESMKVRHRVLFERSGGESSDATDDQRGAPGWDRFDCGEDSEHSGETPFIFGHWLFMSERTPTSAWRREAIRDWLASICVRRDASGTVSVGVVWSEATDKRVGICESRTIRDEVSSWIAWHLVEGGVTSSEWSERTWMHRKSSWRPVRTRRRRFRIGDRGWMDGGNPRFGLPLYVDR